MGRWYNERCAAQRVCVVSVHAAPSAGLTEQYMLETRTRPPRSKAAVSGSATKPRAAAAPCYGPLSLSVLQQAGSVKPLSQEGPTTQDCQWGRQLALQGRRIRAIRANAVSRHGVTHHPQHKQTGRPSRRVEASIHPCGAAVGPCKCRGDCESPGALGARRLARAIDACPLKARPAGQAFCAAHPQFGRCSGRKRARILCYCIV